MKSIFYLTLMFLTACSSTSPLIKSAPSDDYQLKQVVLNVDSFIGKQVRWGGKVIKVNNDDNYSTVHMVQFPLNGYGKPRPRQASQGRFSSQSREFLDPAIFEEGTLVTFAGTVQSKETVTVDKKSLLVPIINITEFHIWPEMNPEFEHGHYYYVSPSYRPYVGYRYYGTRRYYH
jgi:outer membrane lipoprotein